MENVLKQARGFFVNKKQVQEPCVTLGMSTILLMTLACMNITSGLMLTSKEYVGSPITCKGNELEPFCAAESHYYPIGTTIDHHERRSFAFFKYTPFVFLIIGK